MEIQDLTQETIRDKQIVIVEFLDKHCLTFLVTDCKSPQVPGYPACALSYFKNSKKGLSEIKKIYKKLNYYPLNNDWKTKIWK